MGIHICQHTTKAELSAFYIDNELVRSIDTASTETAHDIESRTASVHIVLIDLKKFNVEIQT